MSIKKYFLPGLLLVVLLLTACSTENQIITRTDPSTLHTQAQVPVKILNSETEVSYKLTPELVKQSWDDRYYLPEYFKNYPGFSYYPERKIENVLLDWSEACRTGPCLDYFKNVGGSTHMADSYFKVDDIPKNKNIIAKFFDDEHEFLIRRADDQNINSLTIEEKGKIFFKSIFCEGTFGTPLQNPRLFGNDLTFDFFQGDTVCVYDGSVNPSRPNIFYKGTTINEMYNVYGSRSLFQYKGVVGFIEFTKDHQRYIYFNRKRVSQAFDYIVTDINPDYMYPVFELYNDGQLVFVAEKGEDYYFNQINLNALIDSDTTSSSTQINI